MAATRAHTAPSQGPARQALLAVCSPPALPVGSLSALHLLSAQQGLGLLRRPRHMTCGELFIVEGAPWGGCSLRAGPTRLPPVRYFPLTLAPRTTEKMAEGGHTTMLRETVSPFTRSSGKPEIQSNRPFPRPPKATQILSSDGANFYPFLEASKGNGPHQACGSVQVLSFRLLQCGCDACMVPGAISRGIRATTGFSNSIL